MFLLWYYVQAVNIVVQCFNERLGVLQARFFLLQKGASMGSPQHPVSGDAPARAACLELRSPALEQGQGWGYMRIRFHWLEVRHLKREASQKHSQGPLGWLLKFFMHPEMRVFISSPVLLWSWSFDVIFLQRTWQNLDKYYEEVRVSEQGTFEILPKLYGKQKHFLYYYFFFFFH